jgi:hypothetical protein
MWTKTPGWLCPQHSETRHRRCALNVALIFAFVLSPALLTMGINHGNRCVASICDDREGEFGADFASDIRSMAPIAQWHPDREFQGSVVHGRMPLKVVAGHRTISNERSSLH